MLAELGFERFGDGPNLLGKRRLLENRLPVRFDEDEKDVRVVQLGEVRWHPSEPLFSVGSLATDSAVRGLVSRLGEGFPKGRWEFDKFILGAGGEGVRAASTLGHDLDEFCSIDR